MVILIGQQCVPRWCNSFVGNVMNCYTILVSVCVIRFRFDYDSFLEYRLFFTSSEQDDKRNQC